MVGIKYYRYSKSLENKTNEIPAAQELIEILDVKGIIITADAMYCQRETAKRIIYNSWDYILQLKVNQKKIYEVLYAIFDNKYMDETEKNGKITKEICCYISSKNTTAEALLTYTRNHWQI